LLNLLSGLLLIFILLSQIVAWAGPGSQKIQSLSFSTLPLTLTKYVPLLKFNNQTQSTDAFNLTINSDGSFIMRNSRLDALGFQRPALTNASLLISVFNNASFILVNYQVSGTSYSINLTFNFAVSESSIKMSILSSLANAANLSFTMLFSNSRIYNASLNLLLSQDVNGSAVGINWNDIGPNCFFNQTSSLLTFVLGSGSTFLDPTLIDTYSGIPEDALVYAYQKRVLSIFGLDWVFYCDGTNMKFKTSYDAWSASSILTKVDSSFQFDVATNGSDVSFAVLNGTDFLYYRRGLANNTGGITWYASVQNITLLSGSLGNYFPSIEMNSSGYDWLVFYQLTGAGAKRDLYYVNNVVNGSFISSLNGLLRSGQTQTDYPIVRAGLNGKMFCLLNLNNTGDVLRMRLYNGSAWNATLFQATTDVVNGQYLAAVSNNNNLHITFISYNITAGGGHDGSIIYMMKNSSDSWIERTIVSGPIVSVLYLTPNIACNSTATNQSWVFYYSRIAYPLTEISYRQRFENASWDSAVVLMTEGLSSNNFLARTIHCYPSISNNQIGVIFMDALAAPYNIKITYLSFVTAAWHDITIWQIQLTTRGWNLISNWLLLLTTRGWQTIAVWRIQLIIHGWHLISGWLLQLGQDLSADLAFWAAIGLIFIPMLLLVIVAFKRRH
jgi:hypothetical protein